MQEENSGQVAPKSTKFWQLTPLGPDVVPSLLVSNFFLDKLGTRWLDITPKQTMFVLQLLDNAEWTTEDEKLLLRTNIGYPKLAKRLGVTESALQKRAHGLSSAREVREQNSLIDREQRRITSPSYKTKVLFDLVPLLVELLKLRDLQPEGNLETKGRMKWPRNVIGSEGCTPIAQDFLHKYASLGISDTQALILIQRLRYFSEKNNPEPAIRNEDLAKKVNIKVRQLQKLQRDLHAKRIIFLRDEQKGYPVRAKLTPLLRRLWPERFES